MSSYHTALYIYINNGVRFVNKPERGMLRKKKKKNVFGILYIIILSIFILKHNFQSTNNYINNNVFKEYHITNVFCH